jgi:hypothetical protein
LAVETSGRPSARFGRRVADYEIGFDLDGRRRIIARRIKRVRTIYLRRDAVWLAYHDATTLRSIDDGLIYHTVNNRQKVFRKSMDFSAWIDTANRRVGSRVFISENRLTVIDSRVG